MAWRECKGIEKKDVNTVPVVPGKEEAVVVIPRRRAPEAVSVFELGVRVSEVVVVSEDGEPGAGGLERALPLDPQRVARGRDPVIVEIITEREHRVLPALPRADGVGHPPPERCRLTKITNRQERRCHLSTAFSLTTLCVRPRAYSPHPEMI